MSQLLVPDDDAAIGPPPAAVAVLHNNLMWALKKAYPHVENGWMIQIDVDGGVVSVRNLMLSGKMGFTMKIANIDSEMRNVVRHGGELLERYRIARQKNTDMREALANMRRKPIGEAVYDH
jgi:hypothetical protein